MTGGCYFFYKLTEVEVINENNLESEVHFGHIQAVGGSLLQGIEEWFSKLVIPCFRAQKEWGYLTENGPSPIVSEYKAFLQNFFH